MQHNPVCGADAITKRTLFISWEALISMSATKTKTTYLKAVDPETIETVMKASQEAATKHFEGTMKATTEQMEQATKKMMQTGEQFTGMSREAMEACVQATTIMAKGYEEISRAMMGWSQSSMEQAMVCSKQMLSVKTLREFVDLQTDFAKRMMDSTLSEATRCNEIVTRTSNEAIEPVKEKMASAMGRFGQDNSKAA
jgi:phasin family protein